MDIRFSRTILEQGGSLRLELAKVVESFDIRQALETAKEMWRLSAGYRDLAVDIAGLPEERIAIAISRAIEICALACEWCHSVLVASESNSYLSSIHARQVLLAQDLSSLSPDSAAGSSLLDWVSRSKEIRIDTVQEVILGLVGVPMPVFYSKSHDPFRGISGSAPAQVTGADGTAASVDSITTPTVKLLFSLEESVWSTPQIVRSGVRYDISIKAEILNWPLQMPILKIDYISILDRLSYGLTSFEFRFEPGRIYYEESGYLVVRESQSITSRPSSLRVRARFGSEDDSVSVSGMIVGYNELKFKCIDRESFPVLSEYPTLDVEILNIALKIQTLMPGIDAVALDDFIRCLVYVSKYAGMVAQSGYFKGQKVHEVRDFQSDMVRQLRMTPLGREVGEGGTIAGGRLDIRYRDVVVELKVENSIKDRAELKERYLAQPTQYSSSLLPLSIACILDMTEKDNPPANIGNSISLEPVTVHGFEDASPKYPSMVVVLIIDGNLRSPSDYS